MVSMCTLTARRTTANGRAARWRVRGSTNTPMATSTKVRLRMASHDQKRSVCGPSRIGVELMARPHVNTGTYVDGEMEGQGAFRFAGGDVYEGARRDRHTNSASR